MTSSGPILYPSLKGLEQSNSTFFQVSHPVKDAQRNLSSNHRNTVPRGEKGSVSKVKRNELSAKDENYLNKRYRNDYASSIESHHPTFNEDIAKHETLFKQSNRSNKMSTNDQFDFEEKPKIEKSQELGKKETETTSEAESSIIEEITQTSLMKPESYLSRNKQPMIIINNTFINRNEAEQNEFLRKFSPAIFNNNKNVQSVCDAIPSVIEQMKNNHLNVSANREHESKEKTNDTVQGNIFADIEDTNDIGTRISSRDKNVPVGSIITAILWIILILFWFLLYLKVLNVYNPLPKVIPKPKPTNYELCLIFFRKFGMIIGRIWKS